MDIEVQKIFSEGTVDGNVFRLPPTTLDRSMYEKVKKILSSNGGTWHGRKINGFVFESNPTSIIQELAAGEKVNRKKEFQFFATQPEEIELMIANADLKKTDVVLEPSAGRGAIVERILPLVKKVEMCELMPENREHLEKEKGYEVAWGDFLALNTSWKYDKIIANPPFTKNQDIDHVLKMYEHLNPKGRIVTIMSSSWVDGKQNKQLKFKEWLKEVGASTKEIEAGKFKKSGTLVKTMLVVIDKK